MKLQTCFLVLFFIGWSFAYSQGGENKIGSKSRMDTCIKISFTPMLYDDGADDVENIAIAFAFRVSL